MTEDQAKYLIQILKEWGIYFEDGLTDNEFELIQEKFAVEFPTDLRLFLSLGLPVSGNFINWRFGLHSESTARSIFDSLGWPFEGLIFDVRNNTFWDETWGDKPNVFDKQVAVVLAHFENYPRLIPIYSHRYIPSIPNEGDYPILSVHQTDIIYYGYDLAAYFAKEFHFNLPDYLFDIRSEPKKIEFWGKFTVD